jgi:DnaA N-terminal domain/Helix-turn-helix domain
MSKKPSASLIAHKAINLAGDLTASEKRVAAVLVDCFNFKTHQCDPALNTVAKLLRLSRRTVIRAINALVLKGYLRKETHGGYFHRNSYEPIWSRFRLDEENWATHRKQSRYQKSVPDVTLSKGRPCHTEGDGNGTQTFPLNKSPVTSTSQPVPKSRGVDDGSDKRHSRKASCDGPRPNDPTTSGDAAQAEVRPSSACVLDPSMRAAIKAGAIQLRNRVKPDEYASWFRSIEFEESSNGCLIFSAPNAFIRSRIERDYELKMKESFCPKIHGTSRVRIVVRQ